MTSTDSAKDIIENIEEMGYMTVEPKGNPKPSFYKVSDGTVVRVLISINHIISCAEPPHGYGVNWRRSIACYVPKEKRRPELHAHFDPGSIGSNISDYDMEYETLAERFNVYSINSGGTVSVKPSVAQVNKTKFYTNAGEPVYGVIFTPVFKVNKGG